MMKTDVHFYPVSLGSVVILHTVGLFCPSKYMHVRREIEWRLVVNFRAKTTVGCIWTMCSGLLAAHLECMCRFSPSRLQCVSSTRFLALSPCTLHTADTLSRPLSPFLALSLPATNPARLAPRLRNHKILIFSENTAFLEK